MTGNSPPKVQIPQDAAWLAEPALQKILKVLSQEGAEARIVGGAVRNALMGEPVGDVDIAVTLDPETVMSRARQAGFKVVPTGIDHGTVTIVAHRHAYEVTTLRSDRETDGRHAKVVFGQSWEADASRRDFTINALYADADGNVYDPLGGVADLQAREVKFIGHPDDRIAEDYLRILRFFRFFAWYGKGRPDAAGLKACARLKDGLIQLSAERVWAEMKKLMTAADPARALLWMRQAGVLTMAMPETEKWGIDLIPGLIEAETRHGWTVDPMLRLMAMVPPDTERMDHLAGRLKLSNGEKTRLMEWTKAREPAASTSDQLMRELLYRGDRQALIDRMRLAISRLEAKGGDPAAYLSLLDTAVNWETPVFPVSGRDLLELGHTPGPELGKILARAEDAWIVSGFSLSRDALLEEMRPSP